MPRRVELDRELRRLRAALRALEEAPESVAQERGAHVVAAAVDAVRALAREAEEAHPATRRRRGQHERLFRTAGELTERRAARLSSTTTATTTAVHGT